MYLLKFSIFFINAIGQHITLSDVSICWKCYFELNSLFLEKKKNLPENVIIISLRTLWNRLRTRISITFFKDDTTIWSPPSCWRLFRPAASPVKGDYSARLPGVIAANCSSHAHVSFDPEWPSVDLYMAFMWHSGIGRHIDHLFAYFRWNREE